MQFKYFLLESLLLAAVEAGPLKRIPQFRIRQDGAPSNFTSTEALSQGQVFRTTSSPESLTSSTILPTGGYQIPAVSLVGKGASSALVYRLLGDTDHCACCRITFTGIQSRYHRSFGGRPCDA